MTGVALAMALGACTASGAAPSTDASKATEGTTAPTRGHWLVSQEAKQNRSASGDGPAPTYGPVAATDGTAPLALSASGPLVGRLGTALPTPLPFNYANRYGRTTYVSFGELGRPSVTFVVAQLDGPYAPVSIGEEEFGRHFVQRSDGTELFVDDHAPETRLAVVAANASGFSVTVAAESAGGGSGPPLSREQTVRLAEDLVHQELPTT